MRHREKKILKSLALLACEYNEKNLNARFKEFQDFSDCGLNNNIAVCHFPFVCPLTKIDGLTTYTKNKSNDIFHALNKNNLSFSESLRFW